MKEPNNNPADDIRDKMLDQELNSPDIIDVLNELLGFLGCDRVRYKELVKLLRDDYEIPEAMSDELINPTALMVKVMNDKRLNERERIYVAVCTANYLTSLDISRMFDGAYQVPRESSGRTPPDEILAYPALSADRHNDADIDARFNVFAQRMVNWTLEYIMT